MSQKNNITFVFMYTNFFTKKGGGDFFLSRFTFVDVGFRVRDKPSQSQIGRRSHRYILGTLR